MSKQEPMLAELLTSLTKDELNDIRKNLDIRKASQLNKTELIACLADQIPGNVHAVISRFDQQRFNVLNKALGSKKGLTDEDLIKMGHFNYIYFQQCGLMFKDPATDTHRVPQEVRQLLAAIDPSALKAKLARNTQWVKLAKGLVYFYGYADFDLLRKKISEYTKQEVPFIDFMDVLFDFSFFDEGIVPAPGGIVYYMADFDWVYKEHRIRPELEYYPFPKEQVLQAADDDYVERNESGRKFISFLTSQCGMHREDADFFTEEIQLEFKKGSMPNELIGSLQEQLNIPSMKELQQMVDFLIPLYNETRQWALKGYSSQGMGEHRSNVLPLPHMNASISGSTDNVYSMQTKQKIGRNDPCPCGSGNKYKKCCGK